MKLKILIRYFSNVLNYVIYRIASIQQTSHCIVQINGFSSFWICLDSSELNQKNVYKTKRFKIIIQSTYAAFLTNIYISKISIYIVIIV